jgi:hypothetical protein
MTDIKPDNQNQNQKVSQADKIDKIPETNKDDVKKEDKDDVKKEDNVQEEITINLTQALENIAGAVKQMAETTEQNKTHITKLMEENSKGYDKFEEIIKLLAPEDKILTKEANDLKKKIQLIEGDLKEKSDSGDMTVKQYNEYEASKKTEIKSLQEQLTEFEKKINDSKTKSVNNTPANTSDPEHEIARTANSKDANTNTQNSSKKHSRTSSKAFQDTVMQEILNTGVDENTLKLALDYKLNPENISDKPIVQKAIQAAVSKLTSGQKEEFEHNLQKHMDYIESSEFNEIANLIANQNHDNFIFNNNNEYSRILHGAKGTSTQIKELVHNALEAKYKELKDNKFDKVAAFSEAPITADNSIRNPNAYKTIMPMEEINNNVENIFVNAFRMVQSPFFIKQMEFSFRHEYARIAGAKWNGARPQAIGGGSYGSSIAKKIIESFGTQYALSMDSNKSQIIPEIIEEYNRQLNAFQNTEIRTVESMVTYGDGAINLLSPGSTEISCTEHNILGGTAVLTKVNDSVLDKFVNNLHARSSALNGGVGSIEYSSWNPAFLSKDSDYQELLNKKTVMIKYNFNDTTKYQDFDTGKTASLSYARDKRLKVKKDFRTASDDGREANLQIVNAISAYFEYLGKSYRQDNMSVPTNYILYLNPKLKTKLMWTYSATDSNVLFNRGNNVISNLIERARMSLGINNINITIRDLDISGDEAGIGYEENGQLVGGIVPEGVGTLFRSPSMSNVAYRNTDPYYGNTQSTYDTTVFGVQNHQIPLIRRFDAIMVLLNDF